MDATNELGGEWFEKGETLGESAEELDYEPAHVSLWGRFGLAFAGAGTLLIAVFSIVRAL